jgi:hypothetical protein
MQTRYNYTSGGEFKTSDGVTDYIGFFNVDENGTAYEGKLYAEESSVLLNPISEYSAGYYKSGYYKDRYVYDVLQLPYSLEKILIEPSEIVTSEVLNTKLEYLQNNLIYMYSQMFMGSTDVPVDNNVNILCNLITTSSFKWEAKQTIGGPFGWSNLAAVPSLSDYSEFDNIKRFIIIPFDDDSGVSIVAITDTYVFSLTSSIDNNGQLSGAEFKLYTNIIDSNTSELCKNLEDITFDGRYMYISDSKINGTGQVFKYDVTSYYTNDAAFESKRFLIEPIGGFGGPERKNKFKGCTVLGSKPNEVWVYDSGNNAIKVFDSNFVWITTIKLPNDGVYTVLDIRHRVMNNHTYVLFQNDYDPENPKYGLFEYNELRKLAGVYVFEDVIYKETDGRFNRIAISEQDSNVFYVSTVSSVFKKFFSKPEKTFAVFNRNKFYSADLFQWNLVDQTWATLADFGIWNYAEYFMSNFNITDIYIAASKGNRDNVFFAGESYISHLNERTDYLSLLRKDNLEYYNYDRLKFTGNEYNQSLVLNKEIYKLFANILQFKNNLKGRFYAEYNEYGDLVYKDYIYLADEEINSVDIELTYNTFVNDNELVEPNVLNRIFNKIYELQLSLLKLSKPRIKNYRTWVDFGNDANIYPID